METQILEKATEMFLEKGFKTITMDDIASELSISKKTIYQHYSSKPELIEKSLAYINGKFIAQLETTLLKNQEAIPELLSAHKDIDEVFAINCSASLYELNKYYPKLAQKQKVFYKKKYVHIIEDNLEKGIKEKVYRANVDVEYVARFHLASLIAIDDMDYFPSTEFEHQDIHAMHLEYHIRSIATDKGLKQFEQLIKDI